MRCRIEFMMISGNSPESKCDHHKLYCLLGQSKHCLLDFASFSYWLWFLLERFKKEYIPQAFLHILALALYFLTLKKRREGGGSFLPFSNEG